MKKQILLFFICLSFSLILQAQNNKILEVTPGRLYELTNNEATSITSLTLTGTIDARDFKILRDKLPYLSQLDLSNVNIVAYEGDEGPKEGYYMNYPANAIPVQAFSKNIATTTLTAIVFPKTITNIGMNALNLCNGLTDIVIPLNVMKIEQGAFSNCKGLKTLTINSSALSIETLVFANCTNLKAVTTSSSIPNPVGFNAFYNVDKNLCNISVPYQSAANYRNALRWNEFKNITEATNGFCLSNNTLKLDATAGSNGSVSISSNIEWTASSDQNWLTVNPLSGNGLSQIITLTAEENPSFINYRTAQITLSAAGIKPQVITVTQGVQPQVPKTLKVAAGGLKSALTVEELGSIRDLTLTGTMDARDFKTIRDDMPLLTKLDIGQVNIVYYEGREGTSGDSYNYTYFENMFPNDAFLNESGGSAPIKSIVAPYSLVGIGGNTFHNGLTSLKVLWQLPIVVNGYSDLFYSIKNTCVLYVPYGTASRYAAATGWKNFITIKEETQGLNLSLYKDTISGKEGTSVNVDVTANIPWSISCDQDWLTVAPSSGNGNQMVSLTASANTLFTKRKAIVTVTGEGIPSQSITIIQDIQPQPEKIVELTAGGLDSVLNSDELNSLSILTIKGTIDARDFKTMRDKMPLLTTLDLSGAKIAGYFGTEGTGTNGYYSYPSGEIPERAFCAYNPVTGRSYGKSTLTSIILPSSLTSIGNSAFAYCYGLTKINIPSSVTVIRTQAFDHCTRLINVDISSTVKSIEAQAFSYCESLASVEIPSSVNTIGYQAFAFCKNLVTVTFANGVKSIENYAFWNCSKLTSVFISSSVTSLGSYAFYECLSLSQVTVNWSVPLNLGAYSYVFSNNQNTHVANLYVPFGTVSAYTAAFQWKDFKNIHEMPGFFLLAKEVKLEQTQGSTSSVAINSNVTWTASSDQAWLTVSPDSGSGIEQKLTLTAEANPLYCPRIAKVTVSSPGAESQTIIVTQAQLPANIEVIAGGLASAFTEEELLSIRELTLKGTIDARDFKTMRDKMPKLEKVDLSGTSITAYNGSEGTSLWGNRNYEANKIPEYALYKNTTSTILTSFTFPAAITSIGSNAFSNCTGLTNISIPSMVTTIETQAFYNCSNLISVLLPSSVTKIDYYCFALCRKLTSITVEGAIPPTASYEAFYQVNYFTCVLNVPYKSTAFYQNASEWRNFMKITESATGFILNTNMATLDGIAGSKATVTIDSNIDWTLSSDQNWLEADPVAGTGIKILTLTASTNPSFMDTRTAYVTVSAPGIVSQRIKVIQSAQPQPPKSFEISAGSLAATLTAEELATVTDLTLTGIIDARDFKTMRDKMPMLEKLDLSKASIVAYNGTEGTSLLGNTSYPANTIPEQAFLMTFSGWQGQSTLASIILPESLTAIGQHAFANCKSLSHIIIPESVTDIGNSAFYGCTRLTEITIPSAVISIGTGALGALNARILVDSDNAHYMAEGNVLFNKAQTELLQSTLLNKGSYEIPTTVLTIGEGAFRDCNLLTSVTIPSSVTSIGKSAFYFCGGLTTLTIPSSVSSIGAYAFYYCNGLRTIYTHAKTPVNLDASPSVFYQLYSCSLYVPVGSRSAYQTANQWKDFLNMIEVNPDLIANAGFDKTADERETVTLAGSAFVNTSGTRVTYKWTAPVGITLSSDTIANPTFIAPEVTYYTNLTFSLIICDGINYSTADQVVITIQNVNRPPVANAGVDQAVRELTKVTLMGSASYDPDYDYLSYEWTAPSAISLIWSNSINPTFTAPNVTIDTDFTFLLKVTDGYFFDTDTVVVKVKRANIAPTANAGDNQYKNEGELVTLNGSRSMDPEGDALTYLWTAPQDIVLSSKTAAMPTFTAPEVEKDTLFTFKLIVSDGILKSTISNVTVLVRDLPPVLNLSSKINGQTTPVYLNYKLFMKEGDAFIQKRDTFAVTGETLHLFLEPGNWIALVAPARDPKAFVPTYMGNVLNWNEAEIITMTPKSNVFREINCIMPETLKIGVGQISGAIYQKADSTNYYISITSISPLATNPPVPNAMVRLYKKGSEVPIASVFTDYQGTYKFDKLEIGDYEIVVELPGYVQLERIPVTLMNATPTIKIWFGVNTASKAITDNNSIQLSIVKVYPNPTNGIVYINGLTERAKIAVYTLDGKLILKKETNQDSEVIDITNRVPGTYVFVINDQRFKVYKK